MCLQISLCWWAWVVKLFSCEPLFWVCVTLGKWQPQQHSKNIWFVGERLRHPVQCKKQASCPSLTSPCSLVRRRESTKGTRNQRESNQQVFIGRGPTWPSDAYCLGTLFFLFFFFKKCYWSIVDLQCCVNLCCTGYTVFFFFFGVACRILVPGPGIEPTP